MISFPTIHNSSLLIRLPTSLIDWLIDYITIVESVFFSSNRLALSHSLTISILIVESWRSGPIQRWTTRRSHSRIIAMQRRLHRNRPPIRLSPSTHQRSILFFLKFQFVSRENSKKKERKKFLVYTSSISQRSILFFLKFLFVSQENNKKKERKKFPVNTSSISQRSILFFLKFLFVYRGNNKKRERKKFFFVGYRFIYLLIIYVTKHCNFINIIRVN